MPVGRPTIRGFTAASNWAIPYFPEAMCLRAGFTRAAIHGSYLGDEFSRDASSKFVFAGWGFGTSFATGSFEPLDPRISRIGANLIGEDSWDSRIRERGEPSWIDGDVCLRDTEENIPDGLDFQAHLGIGGQIGWNRNRR